MYASLMLFLLLKFCLSIGRLDGYLDVVVAGGA